jgi:hypothetical protein
VSKLFTKRGNTVGFDAEGRAVVGWYSSRDKLWHVAQMTEHTSEYLTNGTHRLFCTCEAASAHASTLIDSDRTEKLAWWRT